MRCVTTIAQGNRRSRMNPLPAQADAYDGNHDTVRDDLASFRIMKWQKTYEVAKNKKAPTLSRKGLISFQF